MTQIFRDNGIVVPVTRVSAGPCVVTQVKTKEHDGVNGLQVGFGSQKVFRLSKSVQGHVKDLSVGEGTLRHLREVNLGESKNNLKRGDVFTVSIFEPGEKVKVTGKSKGRGFQGVVKRHGFHGSPASHGHKDQLRMPGSIGATGPARVFKGTRMAGQMGDTQVTVLNLEIVEIDKEKNELLIKGAVPGARNGMLLIATLDGEITAQVEDVVEEPKEETKVETTEEPKTEEIKEEVKAEETKEEKIEEPKAEEASKAEKKPEETKEETTK